MSEVSTNNKSGSTEPGYDLLRVMREILAVPSFDKTFWVRTYKDGKEILSVNLGKRTSNIEIYGKYDDGLTTPVDIKGYDGLDCLIKEHPDLEKEIVKILQQRLQKLGYTEPIDITKLPKPIPKPQSPPLTKAELENTSKELEKEAMEYSKLFQEFSDLIDNYHLEGLAERAGIRGSIALLKSNPGYFKDFMKNMEESLGKTNAAFRETINEIKRGKDLEKFFRGPLTDYTDLGAQINLQLKAELTLRKMLKDTGQMKLGERYIDHNFVLEQLNKAAIHAPDTFLKFIKNLNNKYMKIKKEEVTDAKQKFPRYKQKLEQSLRETIKIGFLYGKLDETIEEMINLYENWNEPVDPTNLGKTQKKIKRITELGKEMQKFEQRAKAVTMAITTQYKPYQMIAWKFVEYAKYVLTILKSREKTKKTADLLYGESMIHLPQFGKQGTRLLYSLKRRKQLLTYIKYVHDHLKNNYKNYPEIHSNRERFYEKLGIKRK